MTGFEGTPFVFFIYQNRTLKMMFVDVKACLLVFISIIVDQDSLTYGLALHQTAEDKQTTILLLE